MAGRSPLGLLAVALALAGAPVASAEPPPNDSPDAPQPFGAYSAANGSPRAQQAEAHLAEATADPGVPRCLGTGSFLRTVWFRVPEAASPQEITVEASGRTLDVLDLAAFVQAEVPAPPPPPPPPPPPTDPEPDPQPPTAGPSQAAPLVRTGNACAGEGAGGSDAAEEPTSAVTLRVPARRPVLIQVGRRAAVGTHEDERAILSLETDSLPETAAPAGDRADAAPKARARHANRVALGGATITDEDPATAPCPSLGSVWRRFVPSRTGRALVRVQGWGAETLTVHSGRRPTLRNGMDCVNRAGYGALEMAVRARRKRPLWVRIGTDRPRTSTRVTLRIQPGSRATVVDGGAGGADPTPGGPAGGLPAACDRVRVERARVTGRLTGPAGARNAGARVPVSFRVRGSSVCDAELRLIGPRGKVYAAGRAVRLRGRATVQLSRYLTFRRGRYRLVVTGVSRTGDRVRVRTRVRGRLS